MEQYSIETTQNVEIEFQIASVGDRILAHIIDNVIFFFYFLILIIVFSSSHIIDNHPVMFFSFLSPILFYSLLCETFLNGQSFGKMAMKIRVVRVDGNELTFGNCFIRWIFRLVDFALSSGLVALLVAVINGKGQRLGDIAAGTAVLKTEGSPRANEFMFVQLPPNYSPSYPEVDKLSDNDIRTIRDVLSAVRHESFDIMKNQYITRTSDVVSRKMGVIHKTDPFKFLQTVLYDYTFYHQ
jgi:uncharacterized RDD family membrane protein YckC